MYSGQGDEMEKYKSIKDIMILLFDFPSLVCDVVFVVREISCSGDLFNGAERHEFFLARAFSFFLVISSSL